MKALSFRMYAFINKQEVIEQTEHSRRVQDGRLPRAVRPQAQGTA